MMGAKWVEKMDSRGWWWAAATVALSVGWWVDVMAAMMVLVWVATKVGRWAVWWVVSLADATVALMVLMTVEKMACPWAWMVSVKVCWWDAKKAVVMVALLDESWAGARDASKVETKVVMMVAGLAAS